MLTHTNHGPWCFEHELEASDMVEFSRLSMGDDTVFTDPLRARAEGFAHVVAHPTYLFGLELRNTGGFDWLVEMGARISQLLHAEQEFTYHAVLVAGDRISFDSRVSAVTNRPDRGLSFAERVTRVSARGSLAAELRQAFAVVSA